MIFDELRDDSDEEDIKILRGSMKTRVRTRGKLIKLHT